MSVEVKGLNISTILTIGAILVVVFFVISPIVKNTGFDVTYNE